MNNISAVTIDDEFYSRKLVHTLVTKLKNGFDLVGEADGVQEGFKLINRVKPDVVFLDIKMIDGTGFELLEKFGEIAFEVVFITGFDEYALRAFEFNALDYVLKPIDTEKFGYTLDRLKKRIEKKQMNALSQVLQTYDAVNAIITKIPIHFRDKVMLLDINEIMYIQSDNGCTVFTKSPSEKYTSAKQLSDFEFILSSFTNFVRINKGAFVNLNFVSSYSKGADCYISMQDGSTMEISRRKKTEMLELLSRKKAN